MEMSLEQRREYIVLTAIDVLNECGIYNVSTKEIARRLGISEGLVFKVYPKKNDMLLAVLDHFSRYDNDVYRTAILNEEDPLKGIILILNQILSFYENYPSITAVYQIFNTEKGAQEIDSKIKEIQLKRSGYLMQLVKNAQEAEKLDQSIDAELIADIIISIIRGMCVKWRLLDFSFSLKERTISAIALFLRNITL